jgi:hypothetical protein
VILAANHVRHLHHRIVYHDGEVVGRAAVGSDEHRIADHIVTESHVTSNQIAEGDIPGFGNLEADHRSFTRVDAGARFFERDAAARAVILRRTARRQISFTILVQLRG